MTDLEDFGPGLTAEGEGKSRVTVSIYGETYPLKSSASPQHLELLAEYVDGVMRHIAGHPARIGSSRVAVLAALQIADELFRLRQEHESLTAIFEDEWAKRKR